MALSTASPATSTSLSSGSYSCPPVSVMPRVCRASLSSCPAHAGHLSSFAREAFCCCCSAGSKVRERSGIGGLTSQLLLLVPLRGPNVGGQCSSCRYASPPPARGPRTFPFPHTSLHRSSNGPPSPLLPLFAIMLLVMLHTLDDYQHFWPYLSVILHLLEHCQHHLSCPPLSFRAQSRNLFRHARSDRASLSVIPRLVHGICFPRG